MRNFLGLGFKPTLLPWIFIVAVATGCNARPPKHGTSIVLAIETNHLITAQPHEQLLANTAEVFRARLLKHGIRPFIYQTNDNRMVVTLPVLEKARLTRARRLIEKPGLLELRMVHPESEALLADGIVAAGYEILREERKDRAGGKTFVPFLVNRKAERGLTGKYIKRAVVMRDRVTNKPQINFEFDDEGTRLLAEITREYGPKGAKFHHMAVVLDGVLYSTPRILSPIERGRAMINGDFDVHEALELANVLEDPLEARVRVLEVFSF